MSELASATSQTEFQAKLNKMRQSQDGNIEGSGESTSAQSLSNLYLQNHDPFDDF